MAAAIAGIGGSSGGVIEPSHLGSFGSDPPSTIAISFSNNLRVCSLLQPNRVFLYLGSFRKKVYSHRTSRRTGMFVFLRKNDVFRF